MSSLDILVPYTAFFSFLLGLIFGSFLNVLIPRIKHREAGIFLGRSACPHCHAELKAKDLFPLLSYLFLAGKCRYCQKKISFFYPLIEVATGITFSIFSIHFLLIEQSPIILIIYLFYSLILLFTFFYDLFYLEISDRVLIPATIIALGLSLFFKNSFIPTFPQSLLGLGIPLTFFALQILISRGRWIGGGDLRIGAFMGAILGWQKVIVALVLSYLIGSIAALMILLFRKAKMKSEIPFGPFLSAATLITLLWGDRLIKWYLEFIMLL